MLRLKRNAEEFDAIALFSEMASTYNYKIDDDNDKIDFFLRIKNSINKSTSTDTKIYGHRTENLFCYMAGALGKVILIKQEDSGSIYSTESDIQAPDYRIILRDKKQILVEVKNCHQEKNEIKFRIKKKYFKKLQKYSEINCVELKIAIYFSAFQLWSLLCEKAFKDEGDYLTIDLPTAISKSNMSLIGDCKIGAEPPLEIHFLAGQGEEQEINSYGEVEFVAREIKIYCNQREVVNDVEKNIAFHLIRFGDWVEVENECFVIEKKLKGFRFAYKPTEPTGSKFSFIGDLSTMISKAFNESTTENGKVISLKPKFEPKSFSVSIPEDYRSENLPLWRFFIEPNYDFGSKNTKV